LLAAEEFFAERGAMIGTVDFLSDDEQIAVMVDLANGRGRLAGGDSCAHEEIFNV
jgi:hypothetical protein